MSGAQADELRAAIDRLDRLHYAELDAKPAIYRMGNEGMTCEDELREANERLILAGLRQQEHAERAQKTAAEMTLLLQRMQAAVVVLDAQLNVQLANEAAKELLGLEPQRGAPLAVSFETPDGAPLMSFQDPFHRMLAGEDFSKVELTFVRPDGQRRTVLVGGSAARDSSGRVLSAVAVLQDVTEVRALETMREEYIALLSHDLGAPLTTVTLFSNLLEDILASKGMKTEANNAHRIHTSATRIGAMLRELRETTRWEGACLRIEKAPIDLVQLIGSLCQRITDGQRLRIECGGLQRTVLGDVQHLERAVANLVTNAVKYSPPDAPIMIRCWEAEGEAIATVSDRGPGITPEDQQNIFRKYYRSRNTEHIEGIGLGLYITRLIILAHGGRIWVDSELGKGTTFGFSLPLVA